MHLPSLLTVAANSLPSGARARRFIIPGSVPVVFPVVLFIFVVVPVLFSHDLFGTYSVSVGAGHIPGCFVTRGGQWGDVCTCVARGFFVAFRSHVAWLRVRPGLGGRLQTWLASGVAREADFCVAGDVGVVYLVVTYLACASLTTHPHINVMLDKKNTGNATRVNTLGIVRRTNVPVSVVMNADVKDVIKKLCTVKCAARRLSDLIVTRS